MKKVAIFIPVILAACGSNPPPPVYSTYKQQDLILDKQVNAMSRNEVINAVQECEGNGLRASMVYAKRQINGFTTDVVVDVTCAPKYKYF